MIQNTDDNVMDKKNWTEIVKLSVINVKDHCQLCSKFKWNENTAIRIDFLTKKKKKRRKCERDE